MKTPPLSDVLVAALRKSLSLLTTASLLLTTVRVEVLALAQEENITTPFYHWLEAEFPSTLTAPFEVASDTEASEGQHLDIPNGSGSGALATYTVDIAEAGEYVLWGRVRADNSADDSFFLLMRSIFKKLSSRK